MYGKLISKDQSAYSYLNKTIGGIPSGEVMMEVFKGRIRKGRVQATHLRHLHTLFRNKIKQNIMDKYGLIGLPSGAFVLKGYFN